MDIIDQLYLVYLEEEWWDEPKVARHEIDAYHRILLKRGNIIYEMNSDKLIGYMEVLKINFDQFGRLVCKAEFNHIDEDTTSGTVAVVQSTWIDKEFRNTDVIKNIRNRVYEFTKDCWYFTGIALRKKTQPIKVFKRKNIEDFIKNGNFTNT